MRWSRGARGRVPRLAHRRVSLFFGRCGLHRHHSSISTLSGFARIFASSAGKFFLKPRRPARFARSGAAAPRSWRSRAPSTRARPWSRRARWRTSPRATAPGPCAASARRRDRRDRAGLNNLRQCAAVISFEGAPGDFPSTSPSGPRALKRSTQSRMICRPTPPIRDASVLLPPS